MNKTKSLDGTIRFVLCTALLGALTGCVAHVDEPRYVRVYPQPQPVYVESRVVVLDDYVYYRGYQIYYSSTRRQYTYREGRSWVSRPAPPRVSLDVLFASPSVSLNFHDSPAIHHASVVRQYPEYWTPPGWSPNHGQGNRGKKKGNDRGDRR